MNCTECEELLIDLLYEELDDVRAQAVNAKLADCPDCQAKFEALQRVHGALGAFEMVEPPSHVDDVIMKAARLKATQNAERALQATPREEPTPTLTDRFLAGIRSLVAGPQFAMATVMMLVVALGVWYVPRDADAPLGDTALIIDPDGEAAPSRARAGAELRVELEEAEREEGGEQVVASAERESAERGSDGTSRGGIVNEDRDTQTDSLNLDTPTPAPEAAAQVARAARAARPSGSTRPSEERRNRFADDDGVTDRAAGGRVIDDTLGSETRVAEALARDEARGVEFESAPLSAAEEEASGDTRTASLDDSLDSVLSGAMGGSTGGSQQWAPSQAPIAPAAAPVAPRTRASRTSSAASAAASAMSTNMSSTMSAPPPSSRETTRGATPYQRGIESYRAGNYDDAIENLSTAVDRPGSSTRFVPSALHHLARSHRSNGACRDAVRHYQSLFTRFPQYAQTPQALIEAANCQRRLGRYSTARTLLERAERFESTRTAARRELARLDTIDAARRRQMRRAPSADSFEAAEAF